MKNGRVLLIGFGNPGRRDDGLGPAFAEAIEKLQIEHVDVDANYQLSVEDSETAANHGTVVFVDADTSCSEPYYFKPLEPAMIKSAGFSSHSVSPPEILGLAKELFNSNCRGYILGIRGYEFNEFKEELSEEAGNNLAAAIKFFEPVLRDNSFCTAVPTNSSANGTDTGDTGFNLTQ